MLEPLPEREGTLGKRAQAAVEKLAEARNLAELALAVAQQTQEAQANRTRAPAPRFAVGDKVWLTLRNIRSQRPSRKLDWLHAQYTVTRVFSNPDFYELDTPPGVHNKFHVQLLRPAETDPLPSQIQDDTQPPAIQVNGQDEYGVEAILRCRTRKFGRGSRREALVKWVGYAKPDWQPLANLADTVALDEFEAQYGDAATNDGPKGNGV